MVLNDSLIIYEHLKQSVFQTRYTKYIIIFLIILYCDSFNLETIKSEIIRCVACFTILRGTELTASKILERVKPHLALCVCTVYLSASARRGALILSAEVDKETAACLAPAQWPSVPSTSRHVLPVAALLRPAVPHYFRRPATGSAGRAECSSATTASRPAGAASAVFAYTGDSGRRRREDAGRGRRTAQGRLQTRRRRNGS